jgi:hypothetical protein
MAEYLNTQVQQRKCTCTCVEQCFGVVYRYMSNYMALYVLRVHVYNVIGVHWRMFVYVCIHSSNLVVFSHCNKGA